MREPSGDAGAGSSGDAGAGDALATGAVPRAAGSSTPAAPPPAITQILSTGSEGFGGTGRSNRRTRNIDK